MMNAPVLIELLDFDYSKIPRGPFICASHLHHYFQLDVIIAGRVTIYIEPAALGRQLETEFQRPVTAAVLQIKAAEKSCAALLHAAQTTLLEAQRRQSIAVFIIGLVVGGVGVSFFLGP